MSVILLEFNELTPRLMDKFIGEGVLPNFKRLRDQSVVAVTDAEEQPPALNPWVQWVTIHTGKSFAEHKVFHLSDGPNYKGKRVWDVVSDAGKPVWVCGSMNPAIHGSTINGAVLPDPWSSGVRPYPENLGAFYDLVSRFVQEHTSEKAPVGPAQLMGFARFMVANGLSIATIRAAMVQLATERSKRTHWARAFILDRLQRDVFKHHYKRLKPALATFFSNSTAHFQHFYWRNMEPEHFLVKPTETDQQRFADAVRQGYIGMDGALGEIMEMAGPETSIVFATALSQQPLTKYDIDGGKQLFRPIDPKRLTDFAGITAPHRHEPVMSEKFNLVFESDEAALAAQAAMQALTVEGAPLMVANVAGPKLVLNCAVSQFLPDGALIRRTDSNATVPFDQVFYPIEGIKSGMHHPDGMLWIRTPAQQHAVIDRKVSLQEIAPTLLYLCDVAIPDDFPFPAMPEVVDQERQNLSRAA